MDVFEEVEKLKALILELELPHSDFALFGVMCPYCGKTDRLHKLEEPADVEEAPAAYSAVWEKLRPNGELLVCKFCRQILVLSESGKSAVKLVHP